MVERLRTAVAYAAAGAVGRDALTFSAGIAEFPRDARDQTGLMRLAEGALYRAKRSGRNRCVVYSSFVDAPLSLQEEAERARTAGLANTVYALARAVDLKDGYTHQHSARVAQYAAVLARELGMSEEEIDQIRTAGILHDVGKVGVADAVLLKPARLTDDEFLEMQRHSALGRDIVAGAGMPEIADWVLSLHERWDGRGYPDKLEGEDIPLASRILGVADAFEAMTSSRLYRRGMAVEKALGELERSAAKQFDPVVANLMIELVRSGAIPLGEIGVLDVTHYGSAASTESAAPPEEEGEPVRNVPRGAKRAGRSRARALPALGQHPLQPRGELVPVVAADHVLGLAQLAVPRVDERGRGDAGVDRRLEVLGRVVDQQLDADLAAAGDLVVGAAELVVGQPDPVQPGLRGLLAGGGAVRGDLDEVAGLVPAPDGLDRAGVGLGGEHAVVGVGLRDDGPHLLGPQQRDRPGDLLLVRERDAEPAPAGVGELVPVVVQRRVDVDRDPHGEGR